MVLNEHKRSQPNIDTPFTTTKKEFMYLGVRISPDVKHMVSLNYDLLVDRVREMLNRWAQMPISIIGQIDVMKMLILPKLLYHFQSLPLPLPETFFPNISELCNKFIWNN